MSKNSVQIFARIQNVDQLTLREKECLLYLVDGQSAKCIARVLAISPRTVEIHINNLKKKLACRTRLEVMSKLLYREDS